MSGAQDVGLAARGASAGHVGEQIEGSLAYSLDGDGGDVTRIPAACWLEADLTPLVAGRTLLFYDQCGRGQSESGDLVHLSLAQEVRNQEALCQHFGFDPRSLSLVGPISVLSPPATPLLTGSMSAGCCSSAPSALLIHGQTDLIPVAAVRRFADALPGARLLGIPGVGHHARLEAPDRYFPVASSIACANVRLDTRSATHAQRGSSVS